MMMMMMNKRKLFSWWTRQVHTYITEYAHLASDVKLKLEHLATVLEHPAHAADIR